MLATALLLLIVLLAISVPGRRRRWACWAWRSTSSTPRCRCIAPWARSSGTRVDEYILIAIPMFIMLGEILLRSGIAERIYDAIAQWLSWLPGGLMHANIGACAMFAATSGSSVATAATVGTVALPQIKKRRYDERLFLGTLAAGGTLGILIPPSINFILYGLLTNTSVPRLYLAGIIPGLRARRLLHGDRADLLPGHVRRRAATPIETTWRRSVPRAAGPDPAAVHLPRRGRLDLCRHGRRRPRPRRSA